MKKNVKNFYYLKLIWCFIALLICNVQTLCAMNNNEIVFASSQLIGNLNPLSKNSFSSKLIVQLTTDSLVRQTCTGTYLKPDVFTPGHQFTSLVELNRYYNPLNSEFSLVPDMLPHDISIADIEYTIKQINNSSTNRYNKYMLSFLNKKIHIMNPNKASFNKAVVALTFPVIKAGIISAETKINEENDISIYNQGTTGKYFLEKYHYNEVVLAGRYEELPQIKYQFDLLQVNLLKNIISGKAHIGLNLKGDLLNIVQKISNHNLEECDDFDSFTYFGFNYRNSSPMKKKLFQSLGFRQAFAFSVSGDKIVEQLLIKYGKSLNCTFDFINISNKYPIDYTFRVPGKIDRMAQAIRQSSKVILKIIYRPDCIFTYEVFKDIEQSLNEQFKNGNIHFQVVTVNSLSEFNQLKNIGDFDIIFDTFVYGHDKIRYIDFMNPQNFKINYLHCKLFRYYQIEKYKNDINKRDEYLFQINRLVPVVVLETFRNLNAISKRITKKNKCKDDERPLPFTNIQDWEIKQKKIY